MYLTGDMTLLAVRARTSSRDQVSYCDATRSTAQTQLIVGLDSPDGLVVKSLYVWSHGTTTNPCFCNTGVLLNSNNHENEDCVHFLLTVDWNDKSCTYTVS